MAYPGHLFFSLLLLLLRVTTILSDPDDSQCLTHLYQSISNLQHTNSNPCNGSSSSIDGITCNNGRVFRLSFPSLSLSGTLSPFISNCTNLQALDLSSNSLSGPIPSDLQYLSNLVVLNLSSNSFSSFIPPELALCAYLNVIDLSENDLTGPIPQQLGLLVRLTVLDLRNNRLSGMIPSGLGSRFNVSSYQGGNKGLFGYPLAAMKGGGRGLSVWEIVGIGLGSGFVSLALSFTAVCVWLRVTEKKMMDVEDQVKMGNHHMPDY